ncbi:MAG: mycothiol conjugate amidase Mca [Canibacter sp.]
MTLRLLAVHAHPDDESSKGAATYASYVQAGIEVLIVSCTGGERGDILNETVNEIPMAHRDLTGLRRQEMATARDVVGFEHLWLGYEDSGLPEPGEPIPPMCFADIPIDTSAEALVRVVRRFKPHVMVTYNENGGYPHPDHIRCHEISKRAWDVSGDASVYPEAGAPWEIKKLYYEEIFNAERIRSLRRVVNELQPESPIRDEIEAIAERMQGREYTGTARLNVSDYFEIRDDALRAHASQVPPTNLFFFMPNDIQREAWPYEDYRLAETRVKTREFENDLFEGITDNEAELQAGVKS